MPFNGSVSVPSTREDYAFADCSLVMYEDGGGGGGNRRGISNTDTFSNGNMTNRISGSNSSNSSSSSRSSSSSSSEFDDDTSSWTEDSASYPDGASVFSSGSGVGRTDADTKAKKESMVCRAKWLKSLWTMVDKMDGQRDGDKRSAPSKQEQQQQPVKTILRPPTTYKYVIGMSGLPSKVAVYPKRM